MKAKKILSFLLTLCLITSAIPTAIMTGVADDASLDSERFTAVDSVSSQVTASSVAAICGASTKKSGDNEGPQFVFDGLLSNKLGMMRSGTDSLVLTWQMGSATKITAYTFATANDSPERDPKSWVLYGSSDGTDFTAISTVSGYTAPDSRNAWFYDDFVVESPAEYSFYKLEINGFKNLATGGYPQFSEMAISSADTSDVLNVAALISAIPAESDAGYSDALAKAQTAYNSLSRYMQSTVYNSEVLMQAIKDSYMERVPEESRAAVMAVVDAIDAIPVHMNYKSDKEIDAATDLYSALADNLKQYVYNYTSLTSAQNAYDDLMKGDIVSVSGWGTDISNTPWLNSATDEQKEATWKAYADEVKFQYVVNHYNYDMADSVTAGVYMGNLNLSSEGPGTDHVGNPWGHANRYVGIATVPFSGMSFSCIGYFGANYSYTATLGNSVLYKGIVYQQNWGNVAYYTDTPLVKDNKVTMNHLGYYPGNLGTHDGTNNTFRYAFAEYNQVNKWNNLNMGIPFSHAVSDGNMIYQKFEGPCGTTYIVNSLERINSADPLVEASMKANKGYTITGEIANAVITLGATDEARFAKTGCALSDEYTDKDGNQRQDFEYLSFIVDTATGAVTTLDGRNSISNFADAAIKGMIIEKNEISILVTSGTDLTALAPTFTIPETATSDKASGSNQDFTSDVTYTITAENGITRTYTVKTVMADAASKEDQAAADGVAKMISNLPTTMYRNDRALFQAAIDAYDNLTGIQKLIMSDSAAVEEIRALIAKLDANPIKVTCVGDSITQGIGSSDELLKSYPGQLQAMLGPDYLVTNAGVSGSNAIASYGYAYVTTDRYQLGLTSEPDVVFMMLGTNDAQGTIWNSTSIDAPALFKQDYTKLIKEYQALASNPKIYLALPMTCYNDSTRQTNNMNGTIPIIKEIATELGIEIIDMNAFTANHSDWFGDGLHPSDTGYTYVAEEFKKYVDSFVSDYSDISLSEITVDGTALDGFDPDVFDYSVKYDGDLSGAAIAAVSENAAHSVEVTSPTADSKVAVITVVSDKFGFGKTYTIRFNAVMPGDIDGDGKITVSDVVALRKIIMTGNPTDDQKSVGDLDGDGNISVVDVIELRKIIMAG